MARRSIAYIDGFNFYYGLLRGPHRDCKWLDFVSLFRAIRQADDLVAVKYFTAIWPDDSGERHKVYLAARAQNPILEIVLGRFKSKTLECRVSSCLFGGSRRFRSFEEKETDVNIAVHMLDDAYRAACDIMVLVSADSDLMPAVNLVKTRFPSMRIAAYIPGPTERFRNAIELRAGCHQARTVPSNLLRNFQLPPRVALPGGAVAIKPQSW
ncbi:MAG TPA: hypothetical protein DEB06_03865 [Phycisphaerales bacterium]|nr:hypothetical protein [Phycisphaerales bacterium]